MASSSVTDGKPSAAEDLPPASITRIPSIKITHADGDVTGYAETTSGNPGLESSANNKNGVTHSPSAIASQDLSNNDEDLSVDWGYIPIGLQRQSSAEISQNLLTSESSELPQQVANHSGGSLTVGQNGSNNDEGSSAGGGYFTLGLQRQPSGEMLTSKRYEPPKRTANHQEAESSTVSVENGQETGMSRRASLVASIFNEIRGETRDSLIDEYINEFDPADPNTANLVHPAFRGDTNTTVPEPWFKEDTLGGLQQKASAPMLIGPNNIGASRLCRPASISETQSVHRYFRPLSLDKPLPELPAITRQAIIEDKEFGKIGCRPMLPASSYRPDLASSSPDTDTGSLLTKSSAENVGHPPWQENVSEQSWFFPPLIIPRTEEEASNVRQGQRDYARALRAVTAVEKVIETQQQGKEKSKKALWKKLKTVVNKGRKLFVRLVGGRKG